MTGLLTCKTCPEDLVSLRLHPYRTICRNCTLNMSTSKKHQTFCSESMAGKPVTALPGIGKANGRRLQDHGASSATQVLGYYLTSGGDQSKFQSWLKENSGANSRQCAECYDGLVGLATEDDPLPFRVTP
ncbi:hypothetical protein NFI96_008237 [Prochilodus magdalenae]|nr:hypothetical protein NFI96_008237 [Prochilodus magdalenae]